MRYFILLLSFLAGQQLSAQILYFEDFSNVPFTPPAVSISNTVTGGAMTPYNVDGLTPHANVGYVTDAWVIREDFLYDPADTVAFSTSWYSPVGQSDDWMVTPQISIPAAATSVTLSWDAVAPDVDFPDGYEVYISTAGNTPGDFLATTPVFTIADELGTWTSRSVSLLPYLNEDIYIAFRNNSDDEFLLMMDDIEVLVGDPLNDLALSAVSRPSDFFFINLNQIRGCAFDFGALLTNQGPSATNAFVKCNVYKNSDTVLMATFYSDTIASLAQDSAMVVSFIDSFAPVDSGVYLIEYIACMDDVDTLNDNDTIVTAVVVTANFLSRDVNTLNGSIGIVGTVGRMGQTFILKNDDQLLGLTCYFVSPPVGESTRYYLYSVDTSSGMPDQVIDSTDAHTFTMSDSIGFLTLNFPAPIDLLPGTYFVALQQEFGNVGVGYSSNLFTPMTAWVTWPTAPVQPWGVFENYGFSIALIMRPIFNPCVENWHLDYVISGLEDDIKYEANNNITSTDVIESGAGNILYDAGVEIDLLSGFEVELGAEMEAIIDGCGGARSHRIWDMSGHLQRNSKQVRHDDLMSAYRKSANKLKYN